MLLLARRIAGGGASCSLPGLLRPDPSPAAALPATRALHGVGRRVGSPRGASPPPGGGVPVVIAGGGPTGLVLSYLLSKLGVPSLVVERAAAPSPHPQAHYVNNRSMEIFRHMDGLASEVSSLSPPREEWRRFVYCRSMTGEVLGQVDHFEEEEAGGGGATSPASVAHLAQSRLVPALLSRARAAAEELGGGAGVLFGQEVESFQDAGAGGVAVRVRGAGGRGPTGYEVACGHLVACDGANSRTRGQLGIEMNGEPALQHLINVHFTSPELAGALKSRPAMLYFAYNPEVVAVIVAHDLARGDFVAQLPFYPPHQSPGDFDDATCRQLVTAVAGMPLSDLTIREIRPWVMSAQVAEAYSKGRVFLAGDAAHRFPPAGGFGMNTGIQDAHNLAWKLAAVHSGAAPPALLRTYGEERRPVAVANSSLSVGNYWDAVRVPQAMGLDPRAARLLSAAASVGPLGYLPRWIGRGIVEGTMAVGRAALASPSTPLRPVQEAAVRAVFAEGRTLRLNFPLEDLGFRYDARGGALAPPDGAPARGAGGGARGGGLAPRGGVPARGAARGLFVPETVVGGRLPHCALRAAGGGEVSSLDLAPCGGGGQVMELTAVVAAGSAGAAWRAAAEALLQGGLPLAVAEVAAGPPPPLPAAGRGGGCNRFWDATGRWAELRGVGECGVVVVRPDGHVGWMAHATPGDPEGALRAAIERILCRGRPPI